MQILLVVFVVALLAAHIQAKDMWGSKKQRKELAVKAAAEKAASAGSVSKPAAADGGGGSRMSNIGNDVRDLKGKYISMAEEFTASSQFDDMVTPDSIEAPMGQLSNANVGSDNPQMAAMMSMLDPFLDDVVDDVVISILGGDCLVSVLLKQTIKEVIQMAKGYTKDHPEQMDALLKELPIDARAPILKMISGDMSEGLMSSVQNMFQEFQDEGALEEAIQQLIETPEMMKTMGAFGIDAATVNELIKALFVDEDEEEWEEAGSSTIGAKTARRLSKEVVEMTGNDKTTVQIKKAVQAEISRELNIKQVEQALVEAERCAEPTISSKMNRDLERLAGNEHLVAYANKISTKPSKKMPAYIAALKEEVATLDIARAVLTNKVLIVEHCIQVNKASLPQYTIVKAELERYLASHNQRMSKINDDENGESQEMD